MNLKILHYQNILELIKRSKTRLYMLTRKKSPNRTILDQAKSFIYASDGKIDSLDF